MKNFILLIGMTIFFNSCLPTVPSYPFEESEKLENEAKKLSDRLEKYIKEWYRGEVSGKLPESLLPKGYDYNKFKDITLVKYEDIDRTQQWVLRPAHDINFQKLYGSFPDPHCTYLVAPIMYAPFGAELHIKGEFPYCRFFDIQIPPSFYATEYRYDQWSGKGEVSIVDVDIEPEPGHTNPFRKGANRMAKQRSYEVVYKMAMGNPTQLDPSHSPPYRGKGNVRYGSGIQIQGPWGLDTKSGHGRGIWDFGDVWLRYFGVDHTKMPEAGVNLPEMYFELPSGEKFYIMANFDGLIEKSETTMPNRIKGNYDPPQYNSYNSGWDKQFGIFLQIATGGAKALFKNNESDKEYIRNLDKGVNGRGEDMPVPASLEPHATGCNYTGYLTSGMSLKKGKVFVLTGKLPTFPDTRRGAQTMTTAQCRYWSLTTYDAEFPFSKIAGLENTSVMDDEIILDDYRNYIVVYSRPEDRPKNANKENGVTWINWGHTNTQAITLRWISVSPDWEFEFTPNELNLPWSKTTWSGSQYDKSIIGTNKPGFLKQYHPIKHYMSKERFEALGNTITSEKIPKWKTKEGNL